TEWVFRRRPADKKYQYAAQASEFADTLASVSCSHFGTFSSAGSQMSASLTWFLKRQPSLLALCLAKLVQVLDPQWLE
ncbi:MAG: hypothetical protein KDA55_18920, partial [Planctomycetales bacterium]|nr:hypothetical protein [Planctomycetales bacterium]